MKCELNSEFREMNLSSGFREKVKFWILSLYIGESLKKDNLIVDKSKVFALRVIELYKFLTSEKKEFVLSKQLLRSGTSIGANARESIRAQSTADFYAKLTISLKEAEETAYWLELLNESGYIDNDMFKSLYSNCEELIRILVKILKNIK